jgi:hypothetical protein
MNVITETEVSDEGFETDSCFSVIIEKINLSLTPMQISSIQ